MVVGIQSRNYLLINIVCCWQ